MNSLRIYLGSIIGNNDIYLKSIIDNDDVYLESLLDDDDVYLESLLDDDDVYLSKADNEIIKKYINDNYTITGNLTISKDHVVDCTGGVTVDNKSIESLTNGLFRWGKIKSYFDCNGCNITSFEGAPKEVGGYFDCSYCKNITTFEGAPKKVDKSFDCSDCDSLKSLEGAPKKVGGDFFCFGCKNLKITDFDRKKYKIID